MNWRREAAEAEVELVVVGGGSSGGVNCCIHELRPSVVEDGVASSSCAEGVEAIRLSSRGKCSRSCDSAVEENEDGEAEVSKWTKRLPLPPPPPPPPPLSFGIV